MTKMTGWLDGTERGVSFHRWLLVLALVVAGACENPTETDRPTGPVPAAVTVTPASAVLTSSGSTVQLTARAFDANGSEIPNAQITWSSADTTVATVDAGGVVTAAGMGSATITASSGEASGQASIFVSDDPERRALAALFHATDGYNWGDNTHWLSNQPLHTWAGVQATVRGSVTSLRLVRNGLSGSIPAELGELESLSYLNMALNDLTGEIPETLSALTSLRSLDLSGNELSGPVDWLGDLEMLEVVDFGGNALSGELLSEAAKLPRLRFLAVGGNRLSGPIPAELTALPALEVLAVGANSLVGGLPGEFTESLRTLRVGANDLVGLLPDGLMRLDLNELLFPNTGLCTPRTPGFAEWMEGIGWVQSEECSPGEHDRLVLTALYHAMGGDDWTRRDGWLSDESLSTWEGVDTDVLGRVTGLNLAANEVVGEFPVDLTYLRELAELDVSGNPGLAGRFPPNITHLDLDFLSFQDSGLCAPLDQRFQGWLGDIAEVLGDPCGNPEAITVSVPVVYLNQAIQDPGASVPLVADRDALLRIFAVADEWNFFDSEARATFFRDGSEVYTVDLASDGAWGIGTEVDEGRVEGIHQALIPGEILQPGLEMVVEVDPRAELPLEEGSRLRFPETGRVVLDVREMPQFELTVIPMISMTNPDSSVIRATEGITSESALLKQTRLLLPVDSIVLGVRRPLVTSYEVSFENIFSLLEEIQLLRVADGGSGHYMGLMPPVQGGAAHQPGWAGVSEIHDGVIAHELGHNMNLGHAPCGVAAGTDPNYPHGGGRIGHWGYDLEEAALVRPAQSDIMSYCYPSWISDFSFMKALEYRVRANAPGMGTTMARTERTTTLILWGRAGPDETVLQPAVVLDAPVSLPLTDGPYRIEGLGPDGASLFSLSFAPSVEAESGQGHFAFSLPVDPAWADSLSRITLTGPDGWDTLDRTTNRPIGIFTDRSSGRIRRILRGSFALPNPAEGLDVAISLGLPDPAALRRR